MSPIFIFILIIIIVVIKNYVLKTQHPWIKYGIKFYAHFPSSNCKNLGIVYLFSYIFLLQDSLPVYRRNQKGNLVTNWISLSGLV